MSILNCNVDLKNVTCRVHIEYRIMCHNKIIFKVREGSLEALAYIFFKHLLRGDYRRNTDKFTVME